MPYASQSDLETRFGADELAQLADRDIDGVADAAVVAMALADADRTVDGFVGTRYAVPLSPVPDLVARWAADLARYYLHLDKVTEVVKANYEAAIAGLKDVARGTIRLEAAGLPSPEAPVLDDPPLAAGAAPVFTDAAMDGYSRVYWYD